jgi:hypothetical protein
MESHHFALVLVLGSLLVCAGCGEPDTEAPAEDFEAAATDFECLQNWTQVGVFRITNRMGHLDEALDLARDQEIGKQFPVGTILQIFPTEAMVKRGPDFDPPNHNWEYFELDVSAVGSTIRRRGRDDVINRFGFQCFGCHQAAQDFDFICGHSHGCDELPISDDFILLIQQIDPRCPTPTPTP